MACCDVPARLATSAWLRPACQRAVCRSCDAVSMAEASREPPTGTPAVPRVTPGSDEKTSDMANRIVLITGASDGLGKALAHRAAAEGDTVLLHGRSAERIGPVADEIRSTTGNDHLRTYAADLSSLTEVRKLGDDILSNEPRLDVLVNNAGIGVTNPDGGRERAESGDGIELR